MSITFGEDPVGAEVARVLTQLGDGTWDGTESSRVDLKEEAGRRDRAGQILPGLAHNEAAAEHLAGAAACMANTPGGGALIVGVTDTGELIGTNLDTEWLRYRIYELTSRALTADVRQTELHGVPLLVIRVPEAIEPIRWKGRISWRVSDKCVEVDAATWHSKRMIQTHFDWSAQSSTVPASDARAASIEVARRFLRDSSEPHSQELASLPAAQLLRRLNVVTGDGLLTNAGVLAFVGREEPGLDYIRRDVDGGDSRQRVNDGGRGILEELQEVFTHISANNATRHMPRGVATGQVRDLPEQAIREAVVNGLAHREWGWSTPTSIEHIGRTLRVTSPGGFYGGVTAENIITHPSVSRNRALTELFAKVRVAEREGIGVDRMVREMIRLGHRAPEISQIDGPYVRVSLVGDAADTPWMEWLADIEPPEAAEDLNILLLLRRLVDVGWFDEDVAAPLLQLGPVEVHGAIARLGEVRLRAASVAVAVPGVPADESPAWALSSSARVALQRRDTQSATARTWPTRERIARSYARHRGRISSTELAGLTGAAASNVGSVLKALERAGDVKPSRENRRGPNFYYVSTATPPR